MGPICTTWPLDEQGEIATGRTSYLALMQLGYLPDGQTLTSAVSGDGTVMINAVAADDGSLALMLVDLRGPAAVDPVPVEVSTPSTLPADAP